MLFYAGIGSRKVPRDVERDIVYTISPWLAERGLILRSGGAIGCDTAFEIGHDSVTNSGKEIYVADDAALVKIPHGIPVNGMKTPPKFTVKYHPRGAKISGYARKLLDRNACQVLGRDCREQFSSFIVCWTPDGVECGTFTSVKTGGTGQAIRIASAFDIPVFNLHNAEAWDKLQDFVYNLCNTGDSLQFR